MKICCPLFHIVLLSFCVCISSNAKAQCPPGFTSTIVYYDNTVTGFGNSTYNFNMPQFNPAMGTLLSARIDTYISLNFGFYFENNNTGADAERSLAMSVERTDRITSLALGGQSPINYGPSDFYYGPFTLQESDGVSLSGPDYYQMPNANILDNYLSTFPITNTIPFVGTGNVPFSYRSRTLPIPIDGSTSNIVTSNTTADVIVFRIVYTFCAPLIVPSTVKNFTLQKLSTDKLRLSWLIPTDAQGKEYIIEKSTDGRNFSQVGTVLYNLSANGNYSFIYGIQPTDKGYLQFRIKEINADGSYYYSPVRSILLDENKTGIKIYPTLVNDFVQVSMPGQQSKDVLIKLVNASGQVLQQKRSNTNTVTLNFERKLPQGMYVVQVTDMRTQEQFISKIFAQ